MKNVDGKKQQIYQLKLDKSLLYRPKRKFDLLDYLKHLHHYPYNSFCMLMVLIYNSGNKNISIKYLQKIMKKLQVEYFFPFNYKFIKDYSINLIKDLKFLENFDIVKIDENSVSLTKKGKHIAEIIVSEIKNNPLEELTSYPTFEITDKIKRSSLSI